eukprot:TRINITY_DN289_c0_g1_i4.p1 TRINITY_DN289_c0_g1~~TRINITY_DN289_c0_g1_i4.p1  ORF type:complete len:249 (+),score=65.33 TRINITY_DN289_c0_g1_i4:146-892(+)
MIRRPPRSTLSSSSAASDVYKRQVRGTFTNMLRRAIVLVGGAGAAACYVRSNSQSQAEEGPLPVVVTGPSGVGKGTLIGRLLKEAPNRVGFSVSHTTRGPRPGEEDGVHYHFVAKDEMLKMIEAGEFLEYAHVHTNIYGTSKQSVRDVQKQNKICIMDIDVQGAKSIKEIAHDLPSRFVFLAPPSIEELEQRLRGRGTETEEKIQVRIGNARSEMESTKIEGFWDKVLVNNDLDKASKAFNDFVLGGK